ncbi:MAG: protein-glutamate O-methyltransferase CheR, partial [Deltaproteobacteria bacterium]|nr:protein-glutamate O-methyltransferase CheR [Deltaproteobacteria bacterium]
GSSARSTLRKEELAAVRDLAMRQAGLEIDANDQARVERVLRERMRDLGENDLGRYVRELADPSQSDEARRVVEGLLNHETYFFRELGQLGVFRDYVMPELAETRPDRKLYLWSAGCSTGEEAYTIAMMVLDSGLFDGWSVRVLGTDVSRRVLAEARQAVYGPSSFRAMPDGWRERFFVRQRDRYEVVARARGLCQFAQVNLLDESRLSLVGQADVIFCRNVLIHLDDSARARVLATFHDRLRPGGWLLLGHSEGMLPSGTPLRACRLGEELVHRKGSTSEAPAAPDGPSQPAPVRAPMTGAGGR